MPRKFFDISPPVGEPPHFSRKPSAGRRKKIFFGFLGALLLIFIVFVIFSVTTFKKNAENTVFSVKENFKEAANQLNNFEFKRANDSLQSANSGIQLLSSRLKKTFGSLSLLGQSAVNLGQDLIEVNSEAFNWIVNQEGEKLIAKLESLRNNLSQLALISSNLQEEAAEINYSFDSGYSDMVAKLFNNQRFLDALVSWLKQSSPQHILVLFQNSSEIRPAGGFVGSYADLILMKGSLAKIEVRDIYDPDGQLDTKVIPPKPLQLITARWGARDANWFFDFPLSAKKIIQFLEDSKIYKEQGVEFSGAIALNIEVVRDILAVVGPIYLENYQLEINSDNFLSEIQKEVELGRDKKAGEPKRILKVLTPIIFDKLAGLDDRQKQILTSNLSQRFTSKDIMIYFKDLAIESYLKTLGVAGEMMGLDSNFMGDYLAVVNANIGGGKSDAFISQKIKVESEIANDGQVTTYLKIERRHNGQNQIDWWYRATNQNYLQVFLPAKTRLVDIKGNEWKTITSPIDYKKLGYSIDSDIAALESSSKFLNEFQVKEFSMLGKTIFAVWLSVKAGEEKVLEVNYVNPLQLILRDGLIYEYIFEKQSGVNTNFEFFIKAPAGYIWQESGNSVFNFSADNPPSRLILKMTLIQAANQPLP